MRVRNLVAGGLALGLLLMLGSCGVMVALLTSLSGDGGNGGSGAYDCLPLDPGANLNGLDVEQQANVRTIVSVGRQLGVPDKGLVVAIATARQESSWHNYPGGDGASVGTFQQLPAWGSYEQRHNVAEAARLFFTSNRGPGLTGLLHIPGWQAMSITAAAQAVQNSAIPTAYAQWESLAIGIVSRLIGNAPATSGCVDQAPSVVQGSGRLVTVGGITVDASIGDALAGLLQEMRSLGFVLHGSGWRSTARQAELRAQKGAMAALPGLSEHERGLAIDFTNAHGQALNTSMPEYQALVRIAPKYGLHVLNQPGIFEPWHFSVTGH